eukprot:NODE_153_length_16933_cov_0.442141.p9 type:complete len:176 gc:universal NODE_153_length_16933_cov_0.442141:9822-10349(+)
MHLRRNIEKFKALDDFKESMLDEEFSYDYFRCIDILKDLEETASKLEKVLSYDATRLIEGILVIAGFIFSTLQIKEFVVGYAIAFIVFILVKILKFAITSYNTFFGNLSLHSCFITLVLLMAIECIIQTYWIIYFTNYSKATTSTYQLLLLTTYSLNIKNLIEFSWDYKIFRESK